MTNELCRIMDLQNRLKKSTKFLSEGSTRGAVYNSLSFIPTDDENHVLIGLHVRMVEWCKAIFVTQPSNIGI